MFNATEHFHSWDITCHVARRQGDSSVGVVCAAERLYRQAQFRGWRRRAWRRLQGRPDRLVDLTKMSAKLQHSAYEGIHLVNIADIRGSEGRCASFDSAFYPISDYVEERWLTVATALCVGGNLPPVQLVRIGRAYFVRDGHHRISVARALGQGAIEAEIVAWEVEGAPFGHLKKRPARAIWSQPTHIGREPLTQGS